ncbi:acetoacetate decarboxylase [Pseudoalteromonas sp. Ps84H-4]|uniref:acetoacetate decarboxylase n=1 Tax=Pseudoalteromonas sp. Ps84H-4 TaxID=2954502 RepID=UPI00209728D6|nr:acetoacetate decarboxylase [Pseudoalteromonas sp. Ps84H-4]MCO7251209.1 acetoacetate decarboxylase [Pseudoalteromonas sp. Ps84H-4]
MTDHSNYSHFLSNPVAKPPCRMTNAQMYGFFVSACEQKMQAYVDTTLNLLATDSVSFNVLGSSCLLTFTDIEKISSLTPPFSEHGWMQETDIIIWLPVAKMVKGDINHLYWYPAFISVNNIYALINGREAWGYNKYLCEYQMPSALDDAGRFAISHECFDVFKPDSKLAMHELLTIEQTDASISEYLLDNVSRFSKRVADLFDPQVKGIDLALLKQLLEGFIHPQMDQILFKQFPDGEGNKAVYQSVVHSPSVIKKVHQLTLLHNDFKLNVKYLASFPLNDMFGIALGKQSVHLPFYVNMDFDQLGATQVLPE